MPLAYREEGDRKILNKLSKTKVNRKLAILYMPEREPVHLGARREGSGNLLGEDPAVEGFPLE